MLNHTIRIYDYDYRDVLQKLVQKHYEPTIILTKLNKNYFGEEGITVDTMKQFGTDMKQLMNHYSCMYCVMTSNYLGEVIQGFKEAELFVRNVLTITVTENYCKGCMIKNRTRYDENKVLYAVYVTKGCHGRNLNYTKLTNVEGSCEYSAMWSWFIGSEKDAYKTMIRISSDHRDEVFDPFMNNGIIGVAAIETDRHFTGMEPDGAKFRHCKAILDVHGE